MKKSNKKKSLLLILLLFVVGIGIGYAALATTLNINGNTTIEKASWDIHFENLVKTTGSEVATVEASIDDTKTLIEYTVTLTEPGDFYEFTVDMVNNGTIDAMISEVLKEGLTTDQEKYIEYTAEYSGGVELQEKDILKAGEKDNIRVKVKYRDDITSSDLPTENQSLSLKFMVTYIQADETAVERTKFVCRRATELHTEECTQTDASGYCSGAGYTTNGSKGTTTITYGNLGTAGTLVSGDAFDCDVNGDGTYDSETERFYYVSDLYNTSTKQFDSNYATLIFYNNTSVDSTGNIKPDNTSSSLTYYGSRSSGGPTAVIKKFPTINEWSNISLFSTRRTLLNELGGTTNGSDVLSSSFIYTKEVEGIQVPLAARLLTTQEVEMGCGIVTGLLNVGELDRCIYLLENIDFSSNSLETGGYWLETPRESMNMLWFIHGAPRFVGFGSVGIESFIGARPVIEVPKSNILY